MGKIIFGVFMLGVMVGGALANYICTQELNKYKKTWDQQKRQNS